MRSRIASTQPLAVPTKSPSRGDLGRKRCAPCVLACVLVLLGAAAVQAAGDPASRALDTEWARKTARQQLSEKQSSGQPEYNWYDEATDALRPIDVQPDNSRDNSQDMDLDFPTEGETLFSSLVYLIMWVVLAGVLFLLVYLGLLFYLRRSKGLARRKELGGSTDDQRRIEALPLAGRRKDVPLLAAARKFYQEANYAEAIIYYFSYQLMELDKNTHIHLAKGKTNRQYYRELTAKPRLQAIYLATMLVFEDSYFGNHPPTRERFESCWCLLDEFERLVQEAT